MPHGDRLRVFETFFITRHIVRSNHGIHPILKSSQELAVIMRQACGKIEITIGVDGVYRAHRDAQVASQAGVVIQWTVVGVDFRVD